MDEGVRKYIEKQKSPLKEIVQKVRAIILKVNPDIKETFKNGAPWYEGKYYVAALKGKVHVGFSIKGLSSEEKALFEGTGKTMRHIKIFSINDVKESKITQLLKLVKEGE